MDSVCIGAACPACTKCSTGRLSVEMKRRRIMMQMNICSFRTANYSSKTFMALLQVYSNFYSFMPSLI